MKRAPSIIAATRALQAQCLMGGAGGKIKKDVGPRGGVSLTERNEFD